MQATKLFETWAKRFVTLSMINAILALIWLLFPLFYDTRISRTIAGGSVGTWGYIGFLGFIIVGCLGTATFGGLYYLVPKLTNGSINNLLSWLHMVLMEAGTLVTTGLLGAAGYIGGTTILDETARCNTLSGTAKTDCLGGVSRLVHERITPYVTEPIPYVAVFAGIAGVGVLLGVVNLFMALRGPKKV